MMNTLKSLHILNALLIIFILLLSSCSTEVDDVDPCLLCSTGSIFIDTEPAWHPSDEIIAFISSDSTGKTGIYLIREDETNKQMFHDGPAGAPSWSPDGKWLAFHQNAQIFKRNVETDSLVQLTFEGRNFFPAWSSDGQWIAYDNTVCGSAINPPPPISCGILIMNANGSNKKFISAGRMPVWNTLNNNKILYRKNKSENGFTLGNEMWLFDINSNSKELLVFLSVEDGHFSSLFPKYSPDGRKVVFTSQAEGERHQIWVMESDGTNLKQLTQTGGYGNAWSPDGQWIVYTESTETGRLWLMRPDGSGKQQLTFE